jgi:hypothetical protein
MPGKTEDGNGLLPVRTKENRGKCAKRDKVRGESHANYVHGQQSYKGATKQN